jgi:hypothetical protein
MTENMRFARKQAIGDGNCFFHALAELITGPKSIKKGEFTPYDSRRALELREKLAQLFTLEQYVNLDNCITATINLLSRPQFEKIYTNNINSPITTLINNDSQFSEEVKSSMRQCILQDYEMYKSLLGSNGAWAEEWMISFAATALRLNILIYTSDKVWISARTLQQECPVVFIFNWKDAHYDPLFLETIIDNDLFLNTITPWKDAKAIIKMVK